MKPFLYWATLLALGFCNTKALAQTGQNVDYKSSNFDVLQKNCVENEIVLDIERFGFVLHSKSIEGEMFFFPLKKKFIWKVWRNVGDKDIFLVNSAIWNTKTGRQKNKKMASVLINVREGTVYDQSVNEKYFLFDDGDKESREKISTMSNSKKKDNL